VSNQNTTDKKPYSKKDYEESDYRAKVVTARFMMRDGKFSLKESIKNQKEAYKSHDVIMVRNRDGFKIKIETEQKRCWWKSEEWQGYPTIDVPYRKKDSKADTFIQINLYWDTLAVAPMKDVLNAPTSRKNAKCSNVSTVGEMFFNVDLDKFRFFKSVSDDRKQWVEIDKNGELKPK